MMFDWKTEGLFSSPWIAHELNRLGVKTKNNLPGASLLSIMSFTIRSISASPALTGSSIRQSIHRSSPGSSFIRSTYTSTKPNNCNVDPVSSCPCEKCRTTDDLRSFFPILQISIKKGKINIMKRNLSENVMILARCGSMHGLEIDVIGGNYSMLKK